MDEQLEAELFALAVQAVIAPERDKYIRIGMGLRIIDAGYKVLAKEIHPDRGGSVQAMMRLNRARDLAKKRAIEVLGTMKPGKRDHDATALAKRVRSRLKKAFSYQSRGWFEFHS